jgi:cell division septation protein DedD
MRTAPSAPVLHASNNPSQRVVPLHIYNASPNYTKGIYIPEGYKKVWEDDRLNPYRAYQTRSGIAQMKLVWTNHLPRRLVERETGREVAHLFPGLQYPYTSYEEQNRARMTLSTRGQQQPLFAPETARPTSASMSRMAYSAKSQGVLRYRMQPEDTQAVPSASAFVTAPQPKARKKATTSRQQAEDYVPRNARKATTQNTRATTRSRATQTQPVATRVQPKAVQQKSAPKKTAVRAPVKVNMSHRFVQVGLFGDPANAQRTAQRLSAAGLPAQLTKSKRNGKVYNLVAAGPFYSPTHLGQALHRVRSLGFSDAYTR